MRLLLSQNDERIRRGDTLARLPHKERIDVDLGDEAGVIGRQ